MPSDGLENAKPIANGVSGVDDATDGVQKGNSDAGLGMTSKLSAFQRRLCENCQILDLSLERFIIANKLPLQTRGTSRSVLPQPDLRRPLNMSKSRNGSHRLGTLHTVLQNMKTCPLCSLVIKSIVGWRVDELAAKFDGSKAECHISWEIDGRSHEGTFSRTRTRRLHVRWLHDKRLEDSYLVLITPDRYKRLNTDEPLSWEEEALFLGREIIPDQNNHVKMKGWLDSCLSHGGPCAWNPAEAEEFCQITEQSYFGVIDVLDMCLKPLPIKHVYDSDGNFVSRAPEDYIALSYVWGNGVRYKTKLSNIALHKRLNGLSLNYQEMPRAIRDSFDLVRRLGKRYLWIDSLCIIQDSKRSFKLNSQVMDSVYGNAILTICAADGEDATTGLKALHLEEHSTKQIIETCAPGVRLMVNIPAETGIKVSEWNKRAWTFQERLLSKRCLIFTQGRVFFQCRSTTMSEDIVAEPQGAGWSLDLVDAPNRLLLELEKRPIWVYMKSVSLYSHRTLSRPYDILDAFNGLANMISTTMEAPFVFGLPTSHLDLALLWEPVTAAKRRALRPDALARDNSTFKHGASTGDDAMDEFPSWSWCGWDAKIEYRNNMLEGCFTNVHEWLMDRTWISYFIRDGHGRLRPLWDGERSSALGRAERRWRGYETSGHIARHTTRFREVEIQEPPIDGESHVRRSETIEYHRAGPPCDDYGRILSKGTLEQPRKEFWETLPENPYRVVMSDYTTNPDKEFPDQPILQFYTWSTFLRVVVSDNPKRNVGDGMSRYDVEDVIGDWCGSILLNDEWISRQTSATLEGWKDSTYEFIAISEAKSFTQDECDIWTYYVSKDRDQSEWDLFYVLLVEPSGISDHARQRVALGKVFKRGFDNGFSVEEWKEVILR